MKPAQYFALISGVFFLILGLLGFFPSVVEKVNGSSLEMVGAFDNGFGYIFGVIPTNAIHSIIRLSFGIFGILASIALDSTRVYSRALAIGYGLFAVMGLFPYTNTTFGLIPIYGSDVLLHGISAAIGFYFGFIDQPGLLELGDNKPQQSA
ncbi:MAG: DUF4383 domain-containing protein [Oscillatoriales cyanobacterium C42_A2020_001]|nr:DUF4383 domain-containing protein [Leptolyngbyaceae cyanobacterium C42_A2020_001]